MLPYESLLSCVSIDKKIKEKKRKRILNNDLVVLPSHDKQAAQNWGKTHCCKTLATMT